MIKTLVTRIAAGRTDLVVDVFASGGNESTADANGVRLIQWCAYYGDVSALRFLLSKGDDLHTLGVDLGVNAAAFHGHWRLCQFLLENAAPVEGAGIDTGETPLHAALVSEDRVVYDPVVKVLLAAGADANARTLPGVHTSAFMRDCRTRGETPLHRAAASGTADTIGLLLNAGADPTAHDANGDTPLSWASYHRRPVEVLGLLCYGPHSVPPEYRSMRTNLVGNSSPQTASS